jgi:hypothetical protein
MEEFLTTQPPATHEQLLKNPNEKFIVMTCHKFAGNKPEDCGGFTDRLKTLPYWLWLAQMTGRRLLIKYTKPNSLETYLVPPDDSLFDWRLPDGYFDEEIGEYANRTQKQYAAMRRYSWHSMIDRAPWNDTRVIFVNNNLAMDSMSQKLIQIYGGNFTSELVPGMFRRLFKPSQEVQQAIDQTVEQHGLVVGQYAAAHLRLKWPLVPPKRLVWASRRVDKEGGGLSMGYNLTAWNVHLLSDNVINCAMEIMPEARQVYFASDANEAAMYLLHESPWSSDQLANNTSLNVTNIHDHIPKVVTRLDVDKEPIHFDSQSQHNVDAEAMYSIFVDMWIMGHAKCVSHGVGGFPRYAAALTGNYNTCRAKSWRHSDGVVSYCPEYLNKFGLALPPRVVIPH